MARPLIPAGPVALPRPAPRPQLSANATLVEREDVTADIARIRVCPDVPAAAFNPGQYFSLGLNIDGTAVLRPYSTASPRGTTDTLEFLIRRVRTGEFTPTLWRLRAGSRLWIGRPKGLFMLSTGDTRTHLLVSAGTGIAPFISMLSELSTGAARVVVAHGVSYASELAYRMPLEALAAANPRIAYVPTVSRPDAPENAGWTGRRGRVEDNLASIWADLGLEAGSTVAYLCGNPDMVDRSREVLVSLGAPRDAVIHENYWPSTDKHAP